MEESLAQGIGLIPVSGIVAALQQAALFMLALCLLLTGALVAGSDLYWRRYGLRVEGEIIGVRRKRNVFYPVYRYMHPQTGAWVVADSDTGSSLLEGKETGRRVALRMFLNDPALVRPAKGGALLGFGLFLMLPAMMMMGYAFTAYPFSIHAAVMMAIVLGFFALRLYRALLSADRRTAFAVWKAERDRARLALRRALPVEDAAVYAALPEMQAAMRLQRQWNMALAPLALIVAAGLFYGAHRHGHAMETGSLGGWLVLALYLGGGLAALAWAFHMWRHGRRDEAC